MTPARQSELRQLEASDRLEEVRREGPKWGRDAALELSDPDRAAVRNAVDQLIASEAFAKDLARLRELSKRLPGGRDRRLPSSKRALILVTELIANDPLGRRVPGGRRSGERGDRPFMEEALRRMEEGFAKLAGVWVGWADRIESAFPADAREAIAAASGIPERARLVRRVLHDSLREDQGDTFAELTNEQMDQALLLPSEQFARRLSAGTEEPIDFLGPSFGPGGFGPPGGGPPEFDRRGGPGRRFPPGGPPPREGDRPRRPRDF